MMYDRSLKFRYLIAPWIGIPMLIWSALLKDLGMKATAEELYDASRRLHDWASS